MISPLRKAFAVGTLATLGFGFGVAGCAFSLASDEHSDLNSCMVDAAKAAGLPCDDLIEDANRSMLKSGLTGALVGGAGILVLINRRNRKDPSP